MYPFTSYLRTYSTYTDSWLSSSSMLLEIEKNQE